MKVEENAEILDNTNDIYQLSVMMHEAYHSSEAFFGGSDEINIDLTWHLFNLSKYLLRSSTSLISNVACLMQGKSHNFVLDSSHEGSNKKDMLITLSILYMC